MRSRHYRALFLPFLLLLLSVNATAYNIAGDASHLTAGAVDTVQLPAHDQDTSLPENKIYREVDVEVEFKGGVKAWVTHIQRAMQKNISKFTERD